MSFRTRIRDVAHRRGGIILANDYPAGSPDPVGRTVENIEALHPYLCAIKLNLHLLLRLGAAEIAEISTTAHRRGLQVIADIKLNDIDSTNQAAAQNLWDLGFDAVIVNPVMGQGALAKIVASAHGADRGVIALCHMSSPDASSSYELSIREETQLYRIFLDWAVSEGADGVVAGATFPDIIRQCRDVAGGSLEIYSPGVGTQGGSAGDAILAGSDFLIVGRTILNSQDPVDVARHLARQSLAACSYSSRRSAPRN